MGIIRKSMIRQVIKNRNRVERMQRARRTEELQSLKNEAMFKAKLYDELKYIDVLLDSDEIGSIVIEVPDTYLAKFGAAIYSEDLAEYEIKQVKDTPNQFYVRKKYLIF